MHAFASTFIYRSCIFSCYLSLFADCDPIYDPEQFSCDRSHDLVPSSGLIRNTRINRPTKSEVSLSFRLRILQLLSWFKAGRSPTGFKNVFHWVAFPYSFEYFTKYSLFVNYKIYIFILGDLGSERGAKLLWTMLVLYYRIFISIAWYFIVLKLKA